MIYHFLPKSIYTEQFLDFMCDDINAFYDSHLFLILSNNINSRDKYIDNKNIKNIFNFFSILKVFLCLKKNDRIIIHSYSNPYLYLASVCCCWNLSKIAWVIWGGDLYFYNMKKKIKYKCYELFRKFSIKRFGYIVTYKSEYDLAKQYYNVIGKNINFLYPMKFFDVPQKQSKIKNELFILVGNSRSMSNEHIEALNILSKFKDKNIRIFVPLSYGDVPEGYVDAVDKVGVELFGIKYVPIKTIMDLKAYQEFLSSIDIMVCNHKRQEAWGNLFTLLRSGKKVFVRKNTATNIDFTSFGLKFSLTDDIIDMSFDEFQFLNDDDRLNNQKLLINMFSKGNLIAIWNNIFKTITCPSAV